MLKALCLFSMIFLFTSSAYCKTETIICQYPTFSDQEGNHPDKQKFTLTFIVDKENGEAYILGNQGSAHVILVPNKVDGGFTFIEVTPAGNVMTTTIDSKGGTVHSRNTILYGKIVPTQYYGTCEFK